MVALLTPDFSAMASMLVVSMPRSNRASVASRTFSWACVLLVLTTSFSPCVLMTSGPDDLQLNSGKQISTQREESHGDCAEQGNVQCQAKVRSIDEHAAQRVHAIGERIEPGDDGQGPR